jgi:hypothetical protein
MLQGIVIHSDRLMPIHVYLVWSVGALEPLLLQLVLSKPMDRIELCLGTSNWTFSAILQRLLLNP